MMNWLSIFIYFLIPCPTLGRFHSLEPLPRRQVYPEPVTLLVSYRRTYQRFSFYPNNSVLISQQDAPEDYFNFILNFPGGFINEAGWCGEMRKRELRECVSAQQILFGECCLPIPSLFSSQLLPYMVISYYFRMKKDAEKVLYLIKCYM